MLMDSSRFYTCDNCKQLFESGWSEDDAQAESERLWGKRDPREMSVICDDCFKLFMKWRRGE
jgi:DNA-directed RNA polymerase subunit RPC12/RpoP